MDSPELARPRRFQRRDSNRVLAGVASGLGDYFNLDPVLIRIGFVVLTVVGGAGVLLYALCWLLVPETGASSSPARRFLGRPWRIGSLVGLGLLAAAVALLANHLGVWQPPILLAILLIGIGVVLLRDEPIRAGGPADAVPDAPTTRAEPRRRRWGLRSRPRSALGWYTLAALLVSLALAGLFDRVGGLDLVVGQLPALALVVIGAGLIVGAWRGRARILILLGVILLPAVAVASIVDMPLRGRIGDRYLMPHAASELGGRYRVLYGRTTFDLRRRALTNPRTFIDASVALGEIDVLLPRNTAVEVEAEFGRGQVYVFNRFFSGMDLEVNERFGPEDAEHVVKITMEGGIASLGVQWRREWIPPRHRGKQGGPRRGDEPAAKRTPRRPEDGRRADGRKQRRGDDRDGTARRRTEQDRTQSRRDRDNGGRR